MSKGDHGQGEGARSRPSAPVDDGAGGNSANMTRENVPATGTVFSEATRARRSQSLLYPPP